MIIPLMSPETDRVYNLAQIVSYRVISRDADKNVTVCECTFAGGVRKTFTGPAAAIVNGEIHFLWHTYRQLVAAANGDTPLITPVNGSVM
jgi:hypothetical protein